MTIKTALTIKQERFAQKYVELGNASEAYRQSYDAERMAPETVHNEAHVLLKNHEVSARIAELQQLQLKRHAVTADRVIVEMAKIALIDWGQPLIWTRSGCGRMSQPS